MSWQPTANINALRARAQLLSTIREFFSARHILEVTTPALSACGTTDINVHSITAHSASPGKAGGYLHTSPEFAMKRLLAAGSGSIYQVCNVFRDSDYGRNHRQEFTMLEWYRVGYDYQQLMDEVVALVTRLSDDFQKQLTIQGKTYRTLFRETVGLDPAIASVDDCRACCERYGLSVPAGMSEDFDTWLDLLMSMLIAPELPNDVLTFVYDYPASQAALAKIKVVEEYAVAERFELYWGGLELANGFHELTDANEQLLRFQKDNQQRELRGLPGMPIDHAFIAALQAGFPECSGVALGIDRLLMALLAVNDIKDVIAFADEF